MSQSTLSIFRIFHNQLPPLVPDDIADAMKNSLNDFANDQDISVAEVENALIKFGYALWPWQRAYRHFWEATERDLGDHFFLPRLTDGLKKKYQDYHAYGLSFSDLRSGAPAEYFTPEERAELHPALLEACADLHNYARREVCSLSRDKYLRRVEEGAKILEDIKGCLATMRMLAENEREHDNLVNEIKTKIRAFEYGLCLLGPELGPDEMAKAVEFFQGRRHDLNRLRGIHLPVEVNFYDEN